MHNALRFTNLRALCTAAAAIGASPGLPRPGGCSTALDFGPPPAARGLVRGVPCRYTDLMSTILLPLGTTVVTRAFSTLAVEDAATVAGWPDGALPPRVVQYQGTRRTVVIPKRRQAAPFKLDPVPPLSGLVAASESVELWSLGGGVAVAEYRCELETGASAAELDCRELRRHWWALADLKEKIERHATAGTTLHGQRSNWQFPITLVRSQPGGRPSMEEVRAFVQATMGEGKAPITEIETLDFVGAMSWDGAILFQTEGGQLSEDTLAFLIRLICIDWHVHEVAGWDARRLLLNAAGADDAARQVRATLRQFFQALSIAEPFDYCYDDGDVAFVKAVWRAWEREALHTRVTEIIGQTERLYALAADDYREAQLARQTRGQDLLNQTVGLLGILGVAGTVAGIVSTIDFTNDMVGHIARAGWIGGTTLLTLLCFVALIYLDSLRRR